MKINKKMQNSICKMILKWESKLTWDRLVKSIYNDLSFSITRQTLQDYLAIKNEYKLKKQQLQGKAQNNRFIDSGKTTLLKELGNKCAEIEANKKELHYQLSFIEDMIENARTMNIDLEELTKRR